MSELIETIKRNLSKRRYATFFDWQEKPVKEKGVVRTFLETLKEDGVEDFKALDYGPDPNAAPDCVALNVLGERIAFEVTELVDVEIIRRNVKGDSVYRVWKDPEILAGISRLIVGKDSKVFVGGPYSEKILVIHTDEVDLNPNRLSEVLKQASFGPCRNLSQAYLLLSYQPGPVAKHYPYFKLPFSPPAHQ